VHRRRASGPRPLRDVGAHLAINGNEATLGNLHPGKLGADRVAVRHTADGDEYALETLRRRGLVAREAHLEARRFGHDARYLRAEEDFLIAGADALLQRPHQIRIAPRHQGLSELDQAHAGAERIVDAGHLQPDDAAADDEQCAGELRQLERAAGIKDARILGEPGQTYRLGTCRDDALLEADALGT
jgi:hypothetical protein